MTLDPDKIDVAKLIRLSGECDERRITAINSGDAVRDAGHALALANIDWARRISSRTHDDGSAIDDPLLVQGWPDELRRHTGVTVEAAQRLVAMRARVADLRKRHAAAMKRSADYAAWFTHVKHFAQTRGVSL